MTTTGAHRDVGNLICYAIKILYDELDDGKKGEFNFTVRDVRNRMVSIANDEGEMSKLVDDFNYNGKEIGELLYIIRSANFHPMVSQKLKKYVQNKTIIQYGETYKLSGKIIAYLRQGKNIGNKQMMK